MSRRPHASTPAATTAAVLLGDHRGLDGRVRQTSTTCGEAVDGSRPRRRGSSPRPAPRPEAPPVTMTLARFSRWHEDVLLDDGGRSCRARAGACAPRHGEDAGLGQRGRRQRPSPRRRRARAPRPGSGEDERRRRTPARGARALGLATKQYAEEDHVLLGRRGRPRRLLPALDCVDAVVFAEDTPAAVLDAMRPDVWVEGRRLRRPAARGRGPRAWGGRHVLPYLAGRSTTRMISRRRIRLTDRLLAAMDDVHGDRWVTGGASGLGARRR